MVRVNSGRAQLAFQAADLLAQRGRAHMQPFGGSAEMKFGSHRHERLKLPQFHKLTVPLKLRAAQEGVSAGHAYCSVAPKKAFMSCRLIRAQPDDHA